MGCVAFVGEQHEALCSIGFWLHPDNPPFWWLAYIIAVAIGVAFFAGAARRG